MSPASSTSRGAVQAPPSHRTRIVTGLRATLWQPGAYPKRVEGEMLKVAEDAGRALGMRLQFVQARGTADIDRAFSEMTRARVGAVTVLPSLMLIRERRRVRRLKLATRWGS